MEDPLTYHRPCVGCRKYIRIHVSRHHEYGVQHEDPECDGFLAAVAGGVAQFAKSVLDPDLTAAKAPEPIA